MRVKYHLVVLPALTTVHAHCTSCGRTFYGQQLRDELGNENCPRCGAQIVSHYSDGQLVVMTKFRGSLLWPSENIAVPTRARGGS